MQQLHFRTVTLIALGLGVLLAYALGLVDGASGLSAMAVLTPASIAGPTALTNSAGTQIVASGSNNIFRTIHFSTSASGKAVTFSIGADAAGTRIFDATPLTQNVPSIYNGWWVTTARCDGNVNSTTAQIYIAGYTWA